MNQNEFENYVAGLPDVQREANFGYEFFFVGDDHRLPFVTFANSDNDYDHVSNLDREGVFRINIGVSKETFKKLINQSNDEAIDYSVLNIFLPHPDYARQNFICILNPADENIQETKRVIDEAHSIAAARARRQTRQE